MSFINIHKISPPIVKALTTSAFLVCGHSRYQSVATAFASIFFTFFLNNQSLDIF